MNKTWSLTNILHLLRGTYDPMPPPPLSETTSPLVTRRGFASKAR